MAENETDAGGDEFVLAPGMSPLDLVIAREAAAGTAVPPPPVVGARPPAPPRRPWSTAAKALVGLGAAVALAGILTGVALGLGGGDDDESFFAGAPIPTESRSVPLTAGVGAGSAQMTEWLLLMHTRASALAKAMVPLYSSQELTRSRAMALCASWVDEVEDLGALPSAPDPVVESEFRAYVTSAAAFLDACQSGDGPATAEHDRDLQRHNDAMLERIDELVGP